jgi:hypothetical protein
LTTATTLPSVGGAHAVHLGEHRGTRHQLVGQHHGEGFVADGIAGAADGVAEALRVVLVDDADAPVTSDRPQSRSASLGLALGVQLQRCSASSGAKYCVDRPASSRLLTTTMCSMPAPSASSITSLDRRLVADREQFFRYRLGGREEPGSRDRRRG